MGNFKDNPKAPFVVQVPSKIRKRIAMHETEENAFLRRWKAATPWDKVKRILSLPSKPVAKKRGSLWSRLSKGVVNFFNIKPEIRK